MDKAGPFPVLESFFLYFTIPNVSGAVIGDLSIELVRNGSLVVGPTFYLTNITADRYHLSNRAGGLAYQPDQVEDCYLNLTHNPTGRTRLLHWSATDVFDRMLGLSFQNYVISSPVYTTQIDFNGNNQRLLASCTITIYKDATKTQALGVYALSASYTDAELQTYQVLKVS